LRPDGAVSLRLLEKAAGAFAAEGYVVAVRLTGSVTKGTSWKTANQKVTGPRGESALLRRHSLLLA
jgi:hypothetical protein